MTPDTSDDSPNDRSKAIATIRAGLADVVSRRKKPARAALKGLAKKYGIPTSSSPLNAAAINDDDRPSPIKTAAADHPAAA
jgi:hypothetical protein